MLYGRQLKNDLYIKRLHFFVLLGETKVQEKRVKKFSKCPLYFSWSFAKTTVNLMAREY